MEASRFQFAITTKLDRPTEERISDIIAMNHLLKELLSPALLHVVVHELELYVSERFSSVIFIVYLVISSCALLSLLLL